MAGALAPDMIRGPLPRDLAPGVMASAREHQAIDHATDRHRAFIDVREHLRPTTGRFAGIVADVFLDHALANAWHRYGPSQPLPDYASRISQTLTANSHLMPPDMQTTIERMIRYHWLTMYTTVEGMRCTLERMSTRYADRLGIAVDLAPAGDLLQAGVPSWLDAALSQLWPDLQNHLADHRAKRDIALQSPATPPR